MRWRQPSTESRSPNSGPRMHSAVGGFGFSRLRVLNAHSSLPVLAFQQIAGVPESALPGTRSLLWPRIPSMPWFAATSCRSGTDDLAVLRELRRVLKDGGLLCLTVPAYMFLWGEEDEARGHHRRYTASELRRKLNNCGFEIPRVSYFVATGLLPSILERRGQEHFKSPFRGTGRPPKPRPGRMPQW